MAKRVIQNTAIILAAIAAAIAALRVHTDWLDHHPDEVRTRERCYSITRAGKNDCATHIHSCAAQAERDRDPREWMMVPKGTCLKIAGGKQQAS
jgi:uncharacterized membrane protein